MRIERNKTSPAPLGRAMVAMAALWLGAGAAWGQGVTFQEIAAQAGIDYQRAPSPDEARLDAAKVRSTVDENGDGMPDDPYTFEENTTMPFKGPGAPGVAIFDYDGDGDLDIYVTNGPGAANSLYSSQVADGGGLTFLDTAAAAGVTATAQDSTGVCFGDIDNDGDHDLMVLGQAEPNLLFANQGDGTFADITATSGVGADSRASVGCSMGDVDNDGLLDIAVANAFDLASQLTLFLPNFDLNQHNQLFLNTGGNVFADISAAAGLENLAGLDVPGAATITWSLGLVDYDQDGDVDLIQVDDQGGFEPEELIPENPTRGFIHILENDGAGNFLDVTLDLLGERVWGSWQGVTFGDFNRDGRMDVFASNLGDFMWQILPPIWNPAQHSSRWLLQQPDGTFSDPGVGALNGTPLGWGCSAADYDNDGDSDVIYYGGLDFHIALESSNPGTILVNDGAASFTRDAAALAGSVDHTARNDQGLATGDLDGDGFLDIVSVASEEALPGTPANPFPIPTMSPFDAEARAFPVFMPLGPGIFTWIGTDFVEGTLAVEISSGGNGNGWVDVRTLGTVGITTGGRVNRDGIGAVVTFGPDRSGARDMRPIVGGASYASQDSLTAHFGLGSAAAGTVDVLWPGGVRNRLSDVAAEERVTFPEIPCDFAGQFDDPQGYVACLDQALDELVAAQVLNLAERQRFFDSAVACTASPTTLCLQGGRFQVEMTWRDFAGRTGPGRVVPVASDLTGAFYFFNPENWEVHLKVLDGCNFNDRFWVFAGASTNVEYTLTVTDTLTSESQVYSNPLGMRSPAITDTQAFATCP